MNKYIPLFTINRATLLKNHIKSIIYIYFQAIYIYFQAIYR